MFKSSGLAFCVLVTISGALLLACEHSASMSKSKKVEVEKENPQNIQILNKSSEQKKLAPSVKKGVLLKENLLPENDPGLCRVRPSAGVPCPDEEEAAR